ncbi:MAG: phosphatase PAP2 family protein [Caldimonas sp.]
MAYDQTDFSLSPSWGGPIGKRLLGAGASLSATGSPTLGDDVVSRALEAARTQEKNSPFPLLPASTIKKKSSKADATATFFGAIQAHSSTSRTRKLKDEERPALSPSPGAEYSNLWLYDSALRRYLISRVLIDRLELVYRSDPNGNPQIVCRDRNCPGADLVVITRPTDAMAAAQAQLVLAAADHRNAQREQILAQCEGMPGFFLAERGIGLQTKASTVELLLVMAETLECILHAMKHTFAVKRPVSYETVVPMIEAPQHFSFPGGHSSLAFALFWFLNEAGVLPGPYSAHLLNLALIVSQNRVVAGVHYPMDTIGGAVLGIGLASWMKSLLFYPDKTTALDKTSYLLTGGPGSEGEARLEANPDFLLPGCGSWTALYWHALLEWV